MTRLDSQLFSAVAISRKVYGLATFCHAEEAADLLPCSTTTWRMRHGMECHELRLVLIGTIAFRVFL